jgi:hypothetical protein
VAHGEFTSVVQGPPLLLNVSCGHVLLRAHGKSPFVTRESSVFSGYGGGLLSSVKGLETRVTQALGQTTVPELQTRPTPSRAVFWMIGFGAAVTRFAEVLACALF